MLKIEWNEEYSNFPDIIIEVDNEPLNKRENCEFERYEDIWIHVQGNGFVRYFAHSGSNINEGGFGGAPFYFLYKGEPKCLEGAWSSRASIVNCLTPYQIVDVTLKGQYSTSGAITLEKLKEMWDIPAYLLRCEMFGGEILYLPSMAKDRVMKPSGKTYENITVLEVIAEPS